jgi:hypothetical protein
MHLLYADESGSGADPAQKYVVLAGVCLFERQGWWLSSELDAIAQRFDPANPNSVELHGSPMLTGKSFWRNFDVPSRVKAIQDALSVMTCSHHENRIFAVVVNKALISPKDPIEYAFEQLASRFDHFLRRRYLATNVAHRGLILFDKSTYETSIQGLARDFRTVGHSWGILRNLCEVPVFIDSRASRLIQLADLVAYAIFRKWERSDDRFYSIIRDRFDKDGSVTHGLHCV